MSETEPPVIEDDEGASAVPDDEMEEEVPPE